MEVDHVGARESALKLYDELGDASLFLFELHFPMTGLSEALTDVLQLGLHVVVLDLLEHAVVLNEVLEVVLGDFPLVRRRDLVHEVGQLALQLLRRVRLVNVLGDLFLEVSGKIKVKHGRVGQVQLLRELGRLLVELLDVTRHVTDDQRIDNRAERAEQEG